MSFQTLMAADASNVFANPADFAEPTDLTSPSLPDPVRVSALWGSVEKDLPELGNVGDWLVVHVPTAQLAAYGETLDVRRRDKAKLLRYPDQIDRTEEWEVFGVPEEADGMTRFKCCRGRRLAPRGAR